VAIEWFQQEMPAPMESEFNSICAGSVHLMRE